jgi:hypothetical protein
MDLHDQVEGLWRFYEEQAAQVRQHEDLRATVSSTLAAICAAVVALAGVGGLNRADVPAGLVVVLLSALGVALSLKHYERNRFHAKIMGTTRNEIDRVLYADPSVDATRDLRADATRKHAGDYPRTSKLRLHLLWLGLPIGVGLIGVMVIVLALVGVAGAP